MFNNFISSFISGKNLSNLYWFKNINSLILILEKISKSSNFSFLSKLNENLFSDLNFILFGKIFWTERPINEIIFAWFNSIFSLFIVPLTKYLSSLFWINIFLDFKSKLLKEKFKSLITKLLLFASKIKFNFSISIFPGNFNLVSFRKPLISNLFFCSELSGFSFISAIK